MGQNYEKLQSHITSLIMGEVATDVVNLKFYLNHYSIEINPNIKLLDNETIDNVYLVQQFLFHNKNEFYKLLSEAIQSSISLEELEDIKNNSNFSSTYKKIYNYFKDNIDKTPSYKMMFMIFEFKVKGFKSQLEEEVIETTFEEI